MRGWGITALLFGIGGFILPLMGLRNRLLSLFGDSTPYIAGGLVILGLVLVGLSFAGDNQQDQQDQ